jgi:hypothetical protein
MKSIWRNIHATNKVRKETAWQMVSAKYGAPNPNEAVIQIVMAFGMSCPINILKLLPKCQTPVAASDGHLTVLYRRKI